MAVAATQEVELLRRQLDGLKARMDEVPQQSATAALNAAVTGLTEAVKTMGQTASKPRPEDLRVGKPGPYAPGKDFHDWGFTFNSAATPPHEHQSATLLYLLTMLTQKGALKNVRKAGNNGFEVYRQLCLMYGTSDQEGSTGPSVQIVVYKFGTVVQDVEDRLNEFLELVRPRDETNGT